MARCSVQPALVGWLLVSMLFVCYAAVAPQQQRTNYIRVLNEPMKNNTTTKSTSRQIPSASAGLASIVQHDDNDVTSATKSTETVLYYVLVQDASNLDSIYAKVSYIENDLYNTNATMIPCVLGPVSRASVSLANCMDHAQTIQLNVSIHISPQSNVMHYTDVHHHVNQIRPITITTTSRNSANASDGNKKFDVHSTPAIICFVVAGLLTAVFFTYCTCCCCPDSADDDDDDNDNYAFKKTHRDHNQALANKKKHPNFRDKNGRDDSSTVNSTEDEQAIHIKKSSGKYSYQQPDGTTILNAALNQSLVDIDLSRGASQSTDRVML